MKTICTALLGLVLCAAAHADTISLSGVKHQPGEVFDYTFTVEEYTSLVNPDGSLFDADVLNGSVSTHAGSIDCKPCVTTYINDIYEFLPTETVILAQFGNWNLVGSASGVALVDPVATPEPMTLVLLFFGGLWLWAIAAAESRDTYDRREREYTATHCFGK